jgi:hypothetical protein
VSRWLPEKLRERGEELLTELVEKGPRERTSALVQRREHADELADDWIAMAGGDRRHEVGRSRIVCPADYGTYLC